MFIFVIDLAGIGCDIGHEGRGKGGGPKSLWHQNNAGAVRDNWRTMQEKPGDRAHDCGRMRHSPRR